MGKRSRARKGYASVDPAEADEAEEVEERVRKGKGKGQLQIMNVASFKSSVSPPSQSCSLLNQKISLKDVRPAFYVPGMSSLSSPPLPPQPNQRTLESLPKPKATHTIASEQLQLQLELEQHSAAPSSRVTALSEVSASTHNLSADPTADPTRDP